MSNIGLNICTYVYSLDVSDVFIVNRHRNLATRTMERSSRFRKPSAKGMSEVSQLPQGMAYQVTPLFYQAV